MNKTVKADDMALMSATHLDRVVQTLRLQDAASVLANPLH